MRPALCRRLAPTAALFPLAALLLGTPLAAQSPECVVSVNPEPIRVNQPDGTELELRVRGSAWRLWYEDEAGFPLLREDGWYVYAKLDEEGRLVPTAARAGAASRADLGRLGLRAGVQPADQPGAAEGLARQASQPWEKWQGAGIAAPGSGPAAMSSSLENLVILFSFANHGPTGQDRTLPSVSDMDTIMNAVGGDPTLAPTGSVRDHYLENSYGQLSLDSTVAPWVEVSDDESFYAAGNAGLTTLTWSLIEEALELADPLVDFSNFDVDGDGWIDAITFLHSGYGAEWVADDEYGTTYLDRIWSHKSSIPVWTSDEGVRVSDYHISPALWGVSGSEAGHIGVVCHETGHFLGLPDLYDTDGSSAGIGNWDLMAGGAWGFDSSQQYPSHMSAWCKALLGWLSPTRIGPGNHTLARVEDNAVAYRIDSGFPPGEYLLLENRQDLGFDALIPQVGLAVWHVDEVKGFFGFNNPNTEEGYPIQFGWPANGRHYRVALLQADGAYHLERGFNRGDGGDLYHDGGVDAIGPDGQPNTSAYQSGCVYPTGLEISQVALSGSDVTFTLDQPTAPVIQAAPLPAATVGVPYFHRLEAAPGQEPVAGVDEFKSTALATVTELGDDPTLRWSERIATPSYDVTTLGTSFFDGSAGKPQGWQFSDGIWELELPFLFPFYGEAYDRIWVSTDGFVDFRTAEFAEPFNNANYLRFSLRISPLWDSLSTAGFGDDIFVESRGPRGGLTVRWQATHDFSGVDCNFAVTLFPSGQIRFDYGPDTDVVSPSVGISRGEGAEGVFPAGYDGAEDLEDANSILFTPQGSQLPPGIRLGADGVLRGIPTSTGTYQPILRVHDGRRASDEHTFTLTVN